MELSSFVNNYKKLEDEDTIKISHYVIDYCKKKGIQLTNLKLLKLLYFINIEHLVSSNGIPIFEEQFLAWRHGPVLNTVYDYFKFGINSLTDDKIEEIKLHLGKYKINIIDKTLNEYATIDAWDLVEMTHVADGPWQTVFKNNKTSENMCFETISHNFIYNFYKGN